MAWDPVTQKERWRTPGGGSIGGGTVTTAGNLVFQVINDGRLMAYTADKGEKLFEVQTGLRGGMGPPITYMLDGKQYVALVGGSWKRRGSGSRSRSKRTASGSGRRCSASGTARKRTCGSGRNTGFNGEAAAACVYARRKGYAARQ